VLASDARTILAGHRRVASKETLLKLLAYYRCTEMEDAERSIRQWSRGNARCEPKPRIKDLLRIG
jgi:hypothetical protein